MTATSVEMHPRCQRQQIGTEIEHQRNKALIATFVGKYADPTAAPAAGSWAAKEILARRTTARSLVGSGPWKDKIAARRVKKITLRMPPKPVIKLRMPVVVKKIVLRMPPVVKSIKLNMPRSEWAGVKKLTLNMPQRA